MMVDTIVIFALHPCQVLLPPPKGMTIDAGNTSSTDGDDLALRKRMLSEVHAILQKTSSQYDDCATWHQISLLA
jgi:hypothetical protein